MQPVHQSRQRQQHLVALFGGDRVLHLVDDQDLGFEDIPPYYHSPIVGAHYLKVDI